MRKLEIHHIAPYLQYGMHFNYHGHDLVMDGILNYRVIIKIENPYNTEYLKDRGFKMQGFNLGVIKPMLHPIKDIIGHKAMDEIQKAIHAQELTPFGQISFGGNDTPLWVVQILAKYHFDYQGLLKDRLAVHLA